MVQQAPIATPPISLIFQSQQALAPLLDGVNVPSRSTSVGVGAYQTDGLANGQLNAALATEPPVKDPA